MRSGDTTMTTLSDRFLKYSDLIALGSSKSYAFLSVEGYACSCKSAA